jgi:hypothetical protein
VVIVVVVVLAILGIVGGIYRCSRGCSSSKDPAPPARPKRKSHDEEESESDKRPRKGRRELRRKKMTEIRERNERSRYDDVYPVTTPYQAEIGAVKNQRLGNVREKVEQRRYEDEDDEDYGVKRGAKDELRVPLADKLREDKLREEKLREEKLREEKGKIVRPEGGRSAKRIYPQAPGVQASGRSRGYGKPAGYNRAAANQWKDTGRHRGRYRRDDVDEQYP